MLPSGEEMRFGAEGANTSAAGAPGEEWRGRPPLDATVRVFDAAFFRKVITRHDTGKWISGIFCGIFCGIFLIPSLECA